MSGSGKILMIMKSSEEHGNMVSFSAKYANWGGVFRKTLLFLHPYHDTNSTLTLSPFATILSTLTSTVKSLVIDSRI